MALYDGTFAQTSGLEQHRSVPRTVAAVLLLVASLAAIVFAVVNFADLVEHSRENAQDASRPRYQSLGGLGLLPIAIILLSIGAAIAAVSALVGSGTRNWTRSATGTRLRRRFEGYHALTPAQFEALHGAFTSGDPARYLPLPEQTRGGRGVVMIWTADADRVGFVGLTWGNTRRSTRNAPLIQLVGERFDALDLAVRRGLRQPWGADNAATDAGSGAAQNHEPAQAKPPAPEPVESASAPGERFELASNRLSGDGEEFIYPYSVDLSVDGSTWVVGVSEGVTFSAVGANLTVVDALSPTWIAHFSKAEGEWLVPYLRRIEGGESVEMSELVEHFERLHGRAPRTFGSRRTV